MPFGWQIYQPEVAMIREAPTHFVHLTDPQNC